MMRMQLNRLTVPAFQSAFLARIIIALVNRLAPFFVFVTTASNIVLVRFINMVFKPCLLRPCCLFVRGWMKKFVTPKRAGTSQKPTFLILWHVVSAMRAFRFFLKAIWTHLIFLVNVMSANITDFTSFPDSMSIRFCAGSTSNTGFIFSRFTKHCYLWSRFTAIRAGYNRIGLTRITHAEIPAVFFANDTQVFSHTAIIPQLPDLKGITL